MSALKLFNENFNVRLTRVDFKYHTYDEVFGYDVICPFCFTNEEEGDVYGRKRLHIIYN